MKCRKWFGIQRAQKMISSYPINNNRMFVLHCIYSIYRTPDGIFACRNTKCQWYSHSMVRHQWQLMDHHHHHRCHVYIFHSIVNFCGTRFQCVNHSHSWQTMKNLDLDNGIVSHCAICTGTKMKRDFISEHICRCCFVCSCSAQIFA